MQMNMLRMNSKTTSKLMKKMEVTVMKKNQFLQNKAEIKKLRKREELQLHHNRKNKTLMLSIHPQKKIQFKELPHQKRGSTCP